MKQKSIACVLLLCFAGPLLAQDDPAAKPAELKLIKSMIGVWDAEIEVWPQGPDSPSIKFKGVETNRAFGEYWLASDFDTEYQGQTMSLHSIVGYDLDKKQLVGTNIDQGPYAAKLSGKYDPKTSTLTWKTQAKDVDGTPLIQQTTVVQKSETERVLTMNVPDQQTGDPQKLMRIKFVKRK